MYKLSITGQFKKDYKKCKARNFKMALLNKLIVALEKEGRIPSINIPHPLRGKYKNHWECHILADWLLIWLPNHHTKTIKLVRTGTHDDLF